LQSLRGVSRRLRPNFKPRREGAARHATGRSGSPARRGCRLLARAGATSFARGFQVRGADPRLDHCGRTRRCLWNDRVSRASASPAFRRCPPRPWYGPTISIRR